MNMLNHDIYQRRRVSRVADTKLILVNRTPQSDYQVKIPGKGRVTTNNRFIFTS